MSFLMQVLAYNTYQTKFFISHKSQSIYTYMYAILNLNFYESVETADNLIFHFPKKDLSHSLHDGYYNHVDANNQSLNNQDSSFLPGADFEI